jgi:hypothetical protein
MLLTIQPSNTFSEVPPGNYPSKFEGVSEIETQKGKALRWLFKADDGKSISALSDAESAPTPNNKTGRWLTALTGKPLTPGMSVDPSEFIGKRYFVIVASVNGKSRVETFAAMAS